MIKVPNLRGRTAETTFSGTESEPLPSARLLPAPPGLLVELLARFRSINRATTARGFAEPFGFMVLV